MDHAPSLHATSVMIVGGTPPCMCTSALTTGLLARMTTQLYQMIVHSRMQVVRYRLDETRMEKID